MIRENGKSPKVKCHTGNMLSEEEEKGWGFFSLSCAFKIKWEGSVAEGRNLQTPFQKLCIAPCQSRQSFTVWLQTISVIPVTFWWAKERRSFSPTRRSFDGFTPHFLFFWAGDNMVIIRFREVHTTQPRKQKKKKLAGRKKTHPSQS